MIRILGRVEKRREESYAFEAGEDEGRYAIAQRRPLCIVGDVKVGDGVT